MVVDVKSKKRLVIDFSRCLNLSLDKQGFRIEDLEKALKITRPFHYQLVFDLRSSFHHIHLCPDQYELFDFKVTSQDCLFYFIFVVLHFGLRPATLCLIRILKVVTTLFREKGKRLTIFIDDRSLPLHQDVPRT